MDFIRESNRIEGILRDPTKEEIAEYRRFMALDEVTVQDMVDFVKVYQPNAELRDRAGLNVRVGSYRPPAGSPHIQAKLENIINKAHFKIYSPYLVHQQYEHLHPFTDGNGRSGRMLWMWMMRKAPLGFLHTWYYQSLSEGRS